MTRDSPADSMLSSSFPGADELGSCRKTSSSYSKTITGGAEILRVATYKIQSFNHYQLCSVLFFSRTPDRDFRCYYPCEIILLHLPV